MKTNLSTLFLSMIIVSAITTSAKAQNIKVKVQNIRQFQGVISVALCNNADDFMTETYKEIKAKVTPSGDINVEFAKVPKGTYAIRVYQDSDNSGDLTTNIIGIPEEPFGFSNNPRLKIGPPAFSEASFDVKADVNLVINLKQITL